MKQENKAVYEDDFESEFDKADVTGGKVAPSVDFPEEDVKLDAKSNVKSDAQSDVKADADDMKADAEPVKPEPAKKQTFGQAFKAARAGGAKTFEWEGKKFTTDLKSDTKTEAKPAAKTEAKPEVKAEVKAEAKPASPAKPKPDAKPDFSAAASADGSAIMDAAETGEKFKPAQTKTVKSESGMGPSITLPRPAKSIYTMNDERVAADKAKEQAAKDERATEVERIKKAKPALHDFPADIVLTGEMGGKKADRAVAKDATKAEPVKTAKSKPTGELM